MAAVFLPMMKNCLNFILLAALLCACNPSERIGNLTCEYQTEPLSVSERHPYLGWQMEGIMQSAYWLEVYDADRIPLYRSGRVENVESQRIALSDVALQPGSDYYWRVRVADAEGHKGKWSQMAHFRTAPSEEWLDACWIGAITRSDSRLPEGRRYEGNTVNRNQQMKQAWANTDTLSRKSIVLRKDFETKGRVRSAYAYICGLGHYELTLNGRKVGGAEFAPLWSDYDKTLYYNVYDVTSMLKQRNAVGVLLGNGMFNVQGGRYRKLLVSFGPPTLWMKLHIDYEDGSWEDIVSDGTWKYDLSPIVFNDIYGGEDYDARREQPKWNTYGFDASSWRNVIVQESPKGSLRPQNTSGVAIWKRYDVKDMWTGVQKADRKQNIFNDKPVVILDMGQNLSGFPYIEVRGRRGDVVRLTPSESLGKDSLVNQSNSGRPHYYEYTLKGSRKQPGKPGKTEIWQPRFSYYGFRYIQVQGAVLKGQPNPDNLPVIEKIQSCFVSNSLPTTGSFESSNRIFNDTHRLIQMAVRSNMQAVFTDCPHREKLGWLEEVQLNGQGLLYNYDLTTFWPKIQQDMADAQYADGLVPTTAPMYTEFGRTWNDSPEWGSTSVIVPFMYYQRYGDDRLIRRYYPVMRAYVDYLEATSDNHIVKTGLGDWYDFGKERCGFAQNTPVPLSGTAHLYQNIRYVVEAARMLGLDDDAEKYSRLGEEVNKAFHDLYFNEDSCIYGTGSQSSYAIPLYIGMVAPENRATAMEHLLADIAAHGDRLSTGEVGNRYMFELLANEGHDEVLYRMHNHEDVPGYGFQLKFGATTLTEQWDPRQGASWNHFMLGAIDEWFFSSLGGIRGDRFQPGCRHLVIRPRPVGDLAFVHCTTRTLYGQVGVDWGRNVAGRFVMKLTLPGNTTASVWLPGAEEAVEVSAGTHKFDINIKK